MDAAHLTRTRGGDPLRVAVPGRWRDPCPEEGMQFVGLSTWDKHICYRNVAVRPALHLPSAPAGTVHAPPTTGTDCAFDPPGVGWFLGRKEMSDVELLVRAEAGSALPRNGAAPPTGGGEVSRSNCSDFKLDGRAAPSVGSIALALSASTLDCAHVADSAPVPRASASSPAMGAGPPADAHELWTAGGSGPEAAVTDEQARWERVPAHRLVLARWCRRFDLGGDAAGGGEGACGEASEVKLPGVRRQVCPMRRIRHESSTTSATITTTTAPSGTSAATTTGP